MRSTSNTYGNTVTETSGTPQHVTVTGSRGKLLSTTTSGITENFSYFDTGKVKTITDPAGNQANYTDGDCGNSFMTSVSLSLTSRADACASVDPQSSMASRSEAVRIRSSAPSVIRLNLKKA